MDRLTLPVRGMHCAACVGKVERALGTVPGVEQAHVNLASEQATVVVDPVRADLPALQAAVAAAGYELGTPAAPGVDARQMAEQVRAERAAEQAHERRKFLVGA